MKEGIHPDYHKVLFHDSATGAEWVSRSTLTSKESKTVDGEELPLIRLDISAASHPFWTGTSRVVDSEGRVAQYNRRYGIGADNPR